MRRQGGIAVRAHDAEVLEPVVVVHAVDVVEDEGQPRAVPLLPLAAHLALTELETFVVEPRLEAVPTGGAADDEHLVERPASSANAGWIAAAVREVLRGDLPPIDPALQLGEVATRRAKAEVP